MYTIQGMWVIRLGILYVKKKEKGNKYSIAEVK